MGIGCSMYVASARDVDDYRRIGSVPDGWGPGEDDGRFVVIGQFWEAIGAVLASTPDGDVACSSLFGGDPIGDPDITGIGWARLVSASHLAQIWRVLDGLPPERFRDAASRVDLFYEHGLDSSSDDLFYLSEEYERLREAYRLAAGRGESIIIWLT